MIGGKLGWLATDGKHMDGDHLSTTGPDTTEELTAALAQTVAGLLSVATVQDTLDQVVRLAVDTIEGCDFAGVFLVRGVTVTTPVCTDPLVIEVDELQYEASEGPCLEALAQGAAFYADDLGSDSRWPDFGPRAVASGMRSLLALPMLMDGAPGALNLYARYPQAFGVIDRGRGLLLASMAGMAFSSARTHEDEERRSAQLHAALATRELIGQAQGILMERERITSDQAFDILRRASQHLNLKLRDIAQYLIDTGLSPDTG